MNSESDDLRIGLLGPAVVWRKEDHISLGPPRQQAVLASLAARMNLAVPRGELIDSVWGEEQPATATSSVHTYVARLRQILEPRRAQRRPAQLLVSAGAGYRLQIRPEQLDVEVFNTHLDRAQALRGAADLDGALTELNVALGLWRGEALDGIPGPAATNERVRLTELRLLAIEWRAKVMLDLGQHSEVVAELTRIATENPLRERFWCLLMEGLYLSSRQAEALAVFQRARRLLADELGITPGPELSVLHDRIIQGDPTLPIPRATVSSGPAAPAERQRPRTRHSVPAQLPPDLRGFSGRAVELDYLRKAVAADGALPGNAPVVMVISGVAGVGKTALATHFAHEVATSFQDGQIYLDLAGFGPGLRPMSPGVALHHMIASLGVDPDDIPATPDQRIGMLRTLLAGKRVLIMLDNVHDAEQVRPLLPGGSSALVLVTSRNRLDGLLARDGARLMSLPPLSQAESMALLIRDLGEERIASERQAAARIPPLCGHVPLALHIAAERIQARPHLTLGALADELATERRLDVLVAGNDERASMRRVLARSYRDLVAPAARLFRLTSLHEGPEVSSATAAALADVPVPEAQQWLEHLVTNNLMLQVGHDRFKYHDLLRHYATETLLEHDSEEDRHSAIRRLLHWFLYTADAACRVIHPNQQPIALPHFYAPRRPRVFGDREEALRWCQNEIISMPAMARLAISHGYNTIGWQIPVVLLRFFTTCQRHDVWYSAHQVGLQGAQQAGDKYGEAWNLHGLGLAYCSMGQFNKSLFQFRTELKLRRNIQDLFGEAACLAGFGLVHRSNGEPNKAMQYFQRAKAIMRSLGDWSSKSQFHSPLAEADDRGQDRPEPVGDRTESRRTPPARWHADSPRNDAILPTEQRWRTPAYIMHGISLA